MSTDKEAKIAFYREMWNDVRHSDTLDWRIMVVLLPIYTSIFGLGIYFQVTPYMTLLVLIINVPLAWYGLQMTLRSYVRMIGCFISIKFVERVLKLDAYVSQGIVPPQCETDFLSKFSRSRRFPLFITYAILLLALPGGLSVLLRNSVGPSLNLPFGHTVLLGIVGWGVGWVAWGWLVTKTTDTQINDYLKRTIKPCPICEISRIRVTEECCVNCKEKKA